jgi:hypothetical protein
MTVNLECFVNKIVEHLLEELTSEDFRRVAHTLVGQFTSIYSRLSEVTVDFIMMNNQ